MTVEGAPLNHLVGSRFWLGDTLLEATRLPTPCRHIARRLPRRRISQAADQSVRPELPNLRGGVVRLGDYCDQIDGGDSGGAVA